MDEVCTVISQNFNSPSQSGYSASNPKYSSMHASHFSSFALTLNLHAHCPLTISQIFELEPNSLQLHGAQFNEILA